MLAIDVLTAYVICGAAAAVAAGMLWQARSDDPATHAGLRLCASAMAWLAAGLLPLFIEVHSPSEPRVVWALALVTLGIARFTWGLARLSQQRVPPHAPLVGMAVLAAGYGLAWTGGAWALQLWFVGSTLAVLVLAAASQWRLLRTLPSGRALQAERLLAVSMIGFALVWSLRVPLLIWLPGPMQIHHTLMGVPAVVNVYAVMCGVLPIFLSSLVLNVVNARLRRQLQLRAMTDDLTGLMSRRGLREQAPALRAQAGQLHQVVAVLMLDLDHFKRVNDVHGHAAGDDVLREAARRLRAQLRPDALLVRHGGEEFCAVVPVGDLGAARLVAERLREALASRPCRSGTTELPVTASLGLALLQPDEPLEDAIRRADEALYRAKHGGRNRVESMLVAVGA